MAVEDDKHGEHYIHLL